MLKSAVVGLLSMAVAATAVAENGVQTGQSATIPRNGKTVADSSSATDLRVLGWVEKVRVMPLAATISAKLDSGALTSSMHAEDIETFERDGEPWVRFRIEVDDQRTGRTVSERLERPLYRDQRVRGAGGRDERPVVLLKICVGDTVYEEQFALRDRDNMNYPALLGRRTIQHLGLLDVTSTFLVKPRCGPDSPVQAEGEAKPTGNIGSA